MLSDPQTTLARFHHAADDAFDHRRCWLFDGMAAAYDANAARLAIYCDDPMLLSDVAIPDKVARAGKANSLASHALKRITGFDINWAICAIPAPPGGPRLSLISRLMRRSAGWPRRS
ncbi:MAG: aminopeptidase [Paracoccaceae bacterium]